MQENNPIPQRCSLVRPPLFDSLPCLSSWNCDKKPSPECTSNTTAAAPPASTYSGSSRSSSIKSTSSSLCRRQVRFSSEPPSVHYFEYVHEEESGPEKVTPVVEPLMIYYPPPRCSSMSDHVKSSPKYNVLPSPPASPKSSPTQQFSPTDPKHSLHHTFKSWARRFSSA